MRQCRHPIFAMHEPYSTSEAISICKQKMHRIFQLHRIKLACLVLMVLGVGIYVERERAYPVKDLTFNPKPGTRGNSRILYRSGGFVSEGMGSFFQHIKTSAILAYYTGSKLCLTGLYEGNISHGYSYASFMSDLICPPVPTDILVNENSNEANCTVDNATIEELLPSICNQILSADAILATLNVSNCHSIFQKVERELHEDLNDCMSPVYQYLLPSQPSVSMSKHLRIGIHIRWGDLARTNMTKIPRNLTLDGRSVSIQGAIKALSNIQPVGCLAHDIRIYMKGAVKIDGLPYRMIDSGDDWKDLLDYMSNDILIQGVSSYPVLGAFAVTNKVIITEGISNSKYNQRFLHQNKLLTTKEKVLIECPFKSHGRNLQQFP